MSAFFGLSNGLHGELAAGVAQQTASALVSGLWQGLLLCGATAVILKAVAASTARLRFTVWSAVFCVSVAMPFLSLVGGVSMGRGSVAATPHWVFDLRWSYVLATVWVLAAAYRAGDLLLQGFGLRALWRSAVPVSHEAMAALDAPLDLAGRGVEICTSSEVDRPSVIGFFAPRILIPAWLFAQLTATELNHIVLHEMQHLRRRDEWLNLLQKIGLVLLPLNPALFWVDRRLSTERELACDDGVLERTHTPKAYAASLASIAERRLEIRPRTRLGALALAATGMRRRRSELGQRIESILERRSPENRAFSRGLAAALVVGVVGSAAVLARSPQLVSFTPEAAAEQALANPASRMQQLAGSATPVNGTVAAAFQNVSFPQRVKPPVAAAKRLVRTAAHVEAPRQIPEHRVIVASGQKQFVVLTSWEDTPVSRIIVSTPDGRFLLAPYAAVPTQAGWLLVQL